MKTNNDLHTSTDSVPTLVRYLRKAIKLMNRLSPSLTTYLVTRLFCKPIRKKIGNKQEQFYRSGITDVLNIRGFKIKVFRKGSGKAVYIAHGWNSYGYAMRHIVETLVAEGYQVIMPDMPGHGRSSGKFIDQIEMSKVIEALLLHYNAQWPIEQIVTYSWGGTATLLALDRLRKKKRTGIKIQKMVSLSMPASPDAIMDIFIQTLDLPKVIAKGFKRNIELVAEKDGRPLVEAFPIGLPQLLDQGNFDYLLLHGRADNAICYNNSEQLAKRYPHIRKRILKGLCHFEIVKAKQVLAAIIDHFNTEPFPATTPTWMTLAR